MDTTRQVHDAKVKKMYPATSTAPFGLWTYPSVMDLADPMPAYGPYGEPHPATFACAPAPVTSNSSATTSTSSRSSSIRSNSESSSTAGPRSWERVDKSGRPLRRSGQRVSNGRAGPASAAAPPLRPLAPAPAARSSRALAVYQHQQQQQQQQQQQPASPLSPAPRRQEPAQGTIPGSSAPFAREKALRTEFLRRQVMVRDANTALIDPVLRSGLDLLPRGGCHAPTTAQAAIAELRQKRSVGQEEEDLEGPRKMNKRG